MRRLCTFCIVATLALAGCGGEDAQPSLPGNAADVAAFLEDDLPRTIGDQAPGDKLRDVQCIRRSGNNYDCTGVYQMGLTSAKASMAGIDTTDFAGADWHAIREQGSGPINYEVLIREDGAYNFRAR